MRESYAIKCNKFYTAREMEQRYGKLLHDNYYYLDVLEFKAFI